MKKYFKAVVSLVLVTLMCFSLFGCSTGSKKLSIVFDKKYNFDFQNDYTTEKSSFVFHSDHTGYFEIFYQGEQMNSNTYQMENFYLSGQVDFTWKVADDDTVYVFRTKTTYSDDHTEGKTIGLTELPITFGDEFLICLNSNGGVRRYILEGSDLEKTIKTES